MQAARTAAIALGANLGDRSATISRATARIAGLQSTSLACVSSLIETDPIGIEDQPPFLNACCLVRTCLEPRALLAALHQIERDLGRDRQSERRWGPRTIDLDLLLMDDLTIDEPDLTIPHPRMHQRLFVLEPLGEIAGEMVHPILSVSIRELRDRLRGGSATPTGANLLS